MPKKHLLYIHDENFSKELKKSALVNELLEQHYGRHKKTGSVSKTVKPSASGGLCKHNQIPGACGYASCK